MQKKVSGCCAEGWGLSWLDLWLGWVRVRNRVRVRVSVRTRIKVSVGIRAG